jgi:hypothetical protein
MTPFPSGTPLRWYRLLCVVKSTAEGEVAAYSGNARSSVTYADCGARVLSMLSPAWGDVVARSEAKSGIISAENISGRHTAQETNNTHKSAHPSEWGYDHMWNWNCPTRLHTPQAFTGEEDPKWQAVRETTLLQVAKATKCFRRFWAFFILFATAYRGTQKRSKILSY